MSNWMRQMSHRCPQMSTLVSINHLGVFGPFRGEKSDPIAERGCPSNRSASFGERQSLVQTCVSTITGRNALVSRAAFESPFSF